MDKPIIFMFSGQGSQYYQMGRKLFQHNPTFRKWMVVIDDFVRRKIGSSVIDEIYNPKNRAEEPFVRTLFTSPAIFMVEYSLAQVLLEGGVEPGYLLGASLGEFIAATLSGVLGMEECVDYLLKQAETLEHCCKNSSMLTIVASPDLYYKDPQLFAETEIASINFHSHFVISGKNEKIAEISGFLKGREIISLCLPVSFGFHSSWIDPAAPICRDFLKTISFHKPEIPLISCLSGTELTGIPENYFWDVVRKPVQFQQTLQELERKAAYFYLDLGPSGTLATFTKYNLKPDSSSSFQAIMTPFHQELKNLQKILDQV
ncbi:MAG TPA: acyltransferase [Firmicutes bacterium]|jgi:acyl transferase domain-containing protein|nr:acyltransferase [Bacillota bacterium]